MGQPLHLRFGGLAARRGVVVQYLNDAQRWKTADDPAQGVTGRGESAANSRDESSLDYVVPRGLSNQSRSFRLVALDTAQPVAEWQVTPSDNPIAATARRWQPPPQQGRSAQASSATTPPAVAKSSLVPLLWLGAAALLCCGALLLPAGRGRR